MNPIKNIAQFTSPKKALSSEEQFRKAAANGDTEAVKKCIIEDRVDINAVSKEGSKNTALHYACDRNHLQVIKELINARANLELINRNGKTPGDLATNQEVKDVMNIVITAKRELDNFNILISNKNKITQEINPAKYHTTYQHIQDYVKDNYNSYLRKLEITNEWIHLPKQVEKELNLANVNKLAIASIRDDVGRIAIYFELITLLKCIIDNKIIINLSSILTKLLVIQLLCKLHYPIKEIIQSNYDNDLRRLGHSVVTVGTNSISSAQTFPENALVVDPSYNRLYFIDGNKQIIKNCNNGILPDLLDEELVSTLSTGVTNLEAKYSKEIVSKSETASKFLKDNADIPKLFKEIKNLHDRIFYGQERFTLLKQY